MVDAPRIRRLPEAVANRIAAGEVVERPASVVKELVENALDAGAGTIRVDVLGGGLTSIRVTDDGGGMGPEDAVLALTRHATSKLADTADLDRISTMGFRGEALPSIASVARLELSTARRGDGEGTRVRVEAGEEPAVSAAPPVSGTSVEVRDLFFNVPARKKFLKRPTTELGHVSDVVTRLALAHPEVAFHLQTEGRSVLDAPAVTAGTDPGVRLARILGRTTAEQLLPIGDEGLRRAVGVRGWAGRPPLSERGLRGHYIFVNRRFIRDRALGRAVAEAYRGRLPPGRQPVVVLMVDVDPATVDVNVHPQKVEVRFAHGSEVFRAVQSALRRALARIDPAPALPSADPEARRRARAWEEAARPSGIPFDGSVIDPTAAPPSAAGGREPPAGSERARGPERSGGPERFGGPERSGAPRVAVRAPDEAAPKSLGRFVEPAAPGALGRLDHASWAREGGEPPSPGPGSAAAGAEPSTHAEPSTGVEPASAFGAAASAGAPEAGSAPAGSLFDGLTEARRVGVVFGRFLLIETAGELWVLDLEAAAARVAQEEAAAKKPAELRPSQPLLIPVEVELGYAAARVLEAARGELGLGGLELRIEGERVTVLGAPAEARGIDPAQLVRDTVGLALEEGLSPRAAFARALGAGEGSSRPARIEAAHPEEVDALLARLRRCERRDRGLDGRPLLVALERHRMAQLFGRSG